MASPSATLTPSSRATTPCFWSNRNEQYKQYKQDSGRCSGSFRQTPEDLKGTYLPTNESLVSVRRWTIRKMDRKLKDIHEEMDNQVKEERAAMDRALKQEREKVEKQLKKIHKDMDQKLQQEREKMDHTVELERAKMDCKNMQARADMDQKLQQEREDMESKALLEQVQMEAKMMQDRAKIDPKATTNEIQFHVPPPDEGYVIVMDFSVYVDDEISDIPKSYFEGHPGSMRITEPAKVEWWLMVEHLSPHGYKRNADLYYIEPGCVPPDRMVFMDGPEHVEQMMQALEGRKKCDLYIVRNGPPPDESVDGMSEEDQYNIDSWGGGHRKGRVGQGRRWVITGDGATCTEHS